MTHQQAKSGFRVLTLLVVCNCFVFGCATNNDGVILTGRNAFKNNMPTAPVERKSTSDVSNSATGRSRLVARDLVNAMVQIMALDPITTSINMELSSTRYGSVLTSELQRAGYHIAKGVQPDMPGFLQYSIKSVAHIEGPAYEFGISVDGIKLRRQYRLNGDAIEPASSMFVFGAPPDNIVVDDSIFNIDTTKTEVAADVVLASADGDVKLKVKPNEPVIDKTPSKARVMRNLFETRESNYSSLLKNYKDVKQIVLVFANDAITLGDRNKRLTRELVTLYKEETDLMSVIGCSHGNTSVPGENRSLALGRSLRVKEELILSGVNPGRVLDEGCWDKRYFDEMMPRRGVVLTLKRERRANQ